MVVSPEAQILILNAVIMGFAYLGIYPSLQNKTMYRIMAVDLILSALAMIVAGALFWGSDTLFNMLFLNVNWATCTLATLLFIEVPLFYFFIKKYGIQLDQRR